MIVRQRGDRLYIQTLRNTQDITRVRSLPERRFDSKLGLWVSSYTSENWDALRNQGVDLNGIPRPERSLYRVRKHKNVLAIHTPPTRENIAANRSFPDHRTWNPQLNAWTVSPTVRNIAHIEKSWPWADWDEEAAEIRDNVRAKTGHAEELLQTKKELTNGDLRVRDYKFASPDPWRHQSEAFVLSRDESAYGLFMEQGTGKTRVIVDTAAYQFSRGKINAVIVVCPNSVKETWEEQVAEFTPPWLEHEVKVYDAGLKKKQRDELARFVSGDGDGLKLRWLVVNVEGLSTGRLPQLVQEWVSRNTCLMVVDESTRIKSPGAKRTKTTTKLGKLAPYRRILTGTPVTQGPLDLFAQFRFLDPDILGFSSFYAFRNHYALMGGFGGKQVVGYAHLDELQRAIEPYSYRKLKADCLDIPDKVFEKRVVELSPEQKRAYRDLKNRMVTEIGGKEVSVTIVLTQMLRLQQVVGGFLPLPPDDEDGEWVTVPLDGPNPKLEALKEELDDLPGKVIIWARFRAEIDLISHALRERYGPETTVEFHGGVPQERRQEARRRFQDPDSEVRFFVGQVETGGIGLNLQAASTVIYFSNSFSLETRLQSEDRAHRGGQTKSVTYVDLVARDTLDYRVHSVLRGKKNLANLVNGDNFTQWI